MKKVLMVIGTRPEAIKMAPVIKQLEAYPQEFDLHLCVTGQHRTMMDQVLEFFEIKPNSDFDLMEPGQSLAQLSSRLLTRISTLIESYNPDLLLVHGDTSTAMIAALAGFYAQVDIVHVEAGLRTYNIYSPFPEEANRQIISRLARFHMAPTSLAQNTLVKEGIDSRMIAVTGNTVIDALFMGLKNISTSTNEKLSCLKTKIRKGKVVLVTSHRRENQGKGILDICKALKMIAVNNPSVQIVFPVHLNPKILEPVNSILRDFDNILLLEPLDYECFLWLMQRCEIIITDSGGIQEEAPSLNKPVLVMRETTERPEAVDSGAVILVGSDKREIAVQAQKLLTNKSHYDKMASALNPYGDGTAAVQIVKFLKGIYGN